MAHAAVLMDPRTQQPPRCGALRQRKAESLTSHLSGSRVARSMGPLMTWSMLAGSGLSPC